MRSTEFFKSVTFLDCVWFLNRHMVILLQYGLHVYDTPNYPVKTNLLKMSCTNEI